MVSMFSRAYHYSINGANAIFSDTIARSLMTEQEYGEVSASMVRGISFFNPSFSGGQEEALRWIVDNQLSPSPLARAVYTEQEMEMAVRTGARQYIICAAGYDTFAYRRPQWASSLKVFELDLPWMSKDKRRRLHEGAVAIPPGTHFVEVDFTKQGWIAAIPDICDYDRQKKSFCSLLGLSYYLSKTGFRELLENIAKVIPKDSSVVFDYPDEENYTETAGSRAKLQARLAAGANESMLSRYSCMEMESLLEGAGYHTIEQLTPAMITQRFFSRYNVEAGEHQMTAFDNVNYCLAVRV